jgi:hypothetical protein
MPKLEFTALTLGADRRVTVTGPAGDDAEPGDQIFWLVKQGNVIGAGVATPAGPPMEFTDTEANPQPWRPDSAAAVGVRVNVRPSADGSLQVETVSWSQQMAIVQA